MNSVEAYLRGLQSRYQQINENIAYRRSCLDAIESQIATDDLKKYCMQNPDKRDKLIHLFKEGQTAKDSEFTWRLLLQRPQNAFPELNSIILSYIGPRIYS